MQETYQQIREREKAEENKVFTKGLIILIVCGVLFLLMFLGFHPSIEKGRLDNQGFVSTTSAAKK